MKCEVEILLKLISDQEALVRHYEEQRAVITNFVLVASSLAIGFLSQKGITKLSLPVAILLVVLGAYGAVTVFKLYERTQFSSAFINIYRSKIDELYPDAGIAKMGDDIRKYHQVRFPRAGKLHAHQLWVLLHLIIILTGISLTIAILVRK
jgi:hypothetical protein